MPQGNQPLHIALVTAGGAGMFCGSCMHDNTWVRALHAEGVEVTLIPTYTPIRVDEEDLSSRQVFLGGINVYMEYRWPRLWSRMPRTVTRWLDSPRLLNLTRFLGSDASKLGPLTLALLEGEAGPHRREIDELARHLTSDLAADVICFSNALLVGAVRRLRERFQGPIYCILQGDDVFLKDLPEPYASRAVEAIHERSADFDGFLVHSRYYRDFMSKYLGLPPEKFHLLPLGIDLQGHDGSPRLHNQEPFTVGYFARICPEKGLHRLVEAFRILHRRHPNTRLLAGGYLGRRDKRYFRKVRQAACELGDAFCYVGSPETLAEKVALYRQYDVLSVPTEYHEPKGLYVLEAWANGVPVVQPRHGAFPELIEATGGGLLSEPGDPHDLAGRLEELLEDPQRRHELGSAGQTNIRRLFDAAVMARETLALFQNARRKPEAATAQ